MNIYRKAKPAASFPIVPMLDILTILLIFFIVHTEFKRENRVLPLTLPQTQYLAGTGAEPECVLLEVAADGSIALGGKRLALPDLRPALERILRNTPGARLQVAAAEEASLGGLLQVLDSMTAAGLQTEQIPLRIDFTPPARR